MNITGLFIRRPVLATVVSLLILLVGLQSLFKLPIRQYPKLDETVITVKTSYPGASAQVMQGFITTPIQQAIASAEGVDYLTSSSTTSTSTVEAHLKLGANPDVAMTDVMSKVAQVRSQLPEDALDPVTTKTTGKQIDLLYVGFYSKTLNGEQITDFLTRVVQPQMATIDGVAEAEILGQKTFAMRIWLNPERMTALGVSPADIAAAIKRNNFQAAPGQTKGYFDVVDIDAKTGLSSAEGFGDMVVKANGPALVRLKDVATVQLGAQDTDTSVVFNGEPSVAIGIKGTPAANPLTVIDSVRQALPRIEKLLPPGLHMKVVYDSTQYIRDSIHEVLWTIGEAAAIVVVVIFLFLGSLRAVFIPIVTIPLSLVGVCSLLLALGYSLNLLTLLAMVLAIGLVVDDAIVVVENVHRHIEEGLSPFQAALAGAKEIAGPVVSMTITLAAVYAPIGFVGGLTGALFTEFAFTLAGAVIVSGVIALTLSPMMASKFLASTAAESGFTVWLDHMFERLKARYERSLDSSLNYRPVAGLVAVVVLASCYFLYVATPKALAPPEDQGIVFVSAKAPEYANIDYLSRFTRTFDPIFKGLPELQDYFLINGAGAPNTAMGGLLLKPWSDRKRSQAQVTTQLMGGLSQVAGLKAFGFGLPTLPGSTGLPIQFVIASTAGFRAVAQATEAIQAAARKSGLFMVTDPDLQFDKPEVQVHIDRAKAAALGVGMSDIGAALANLLGGGLVNRFDIEGRSYEVIPQLPRVFRLDPGAISRIYVKTGGGGMVPLSSVVTLTRRVAPNALTQFNQMNAATIGAVPMPGVSMGQALTFLQGAAARLLPRGFLVDYQGESRQYVQEGATLMLTFVFAVVVIFLVLAAQFESFRDPLIILISVPMSICGALIPLNLGLATINIFTQIGLVTLVGLIAKHGILIVEFANKIQEEEGLDRRHAVVKSAGIRLRPILMTTAAMVVGVLPLVVATGAGAASRFDIGLVIACGMSVGTLFTLFMVPAVYTLVAADKRPRHEAREAGALT